MRFHCPKFAPKFLGPQELGLRTSSRFFTAKAGKNDVSIIRIISKASPLHFGLSPLYGGMIAWYAKVAATDVSTHLHLDPYVTRPLLHLTSLKVYVFTALTLLREGLPWTALRFMTAKLWRPAWMAANRYPLRMLKLARLIPGAAGLLLLCYVLVAQRGNTSISHWAVGAGAIVATVLGALSMALSTLTPKIWVAYFRTWRLLCVRALVLASLLSFALLAVPLRDGDTVALVLAVWLCCHGVVEHLVDSIRWQRHHRTGSSILGIDRQTLTDDELKSVSIHEAGHLVMYGLLTRLPEDAFAMVDARPVFDFAGFVTPMNDVAIIDMSIGLLRWNAMMAFAGAAAEQLLLGRHTEGALADFGMADTSVRRLAAIDHASLYCRKPVTEGEERTNAETLRTLRVELFDDARRYLDANRGLLIAVSEHLRYHHSMDCEEFEPLWKTAVTPPGFTRIDPPNRIACLRVPSSALAR